MNTADGVEISVGGMYWFVEDELQPVTVTVVKLCLPKKDDLFEDLHTVEIAADGKRWHDFPSELFSTKDLCVAEIIDRSERKRNSMYDELEKLEMMIHSLKNKEKDNERVP